MTARERIEMLLDKGTFVELDKLMVHRCTNYGMDKNKIPGDGIVSGYGKVDGRQVFVYAYDFTVYGGSLSASNAKKIVKVQQLALKNGAPIIACLLYTSENRLPSIDKRIDTFKKLADKIGREKMIWRYDPILTNEEYNVSFHQEAFARIAHELKDHTSKCMLGFIDHYPLSLIHIYPLQ